MDGVGLAFFFAGLMLFVGALFASIGRRLAARPVPEGWLQVPGTIVDWVVGEPSSVFAARHNHGRNIMFPIIEYLLPDGTPHRFRNATTRDNGRRPRGVPVTVLVHPADPRRAELPGTAGQSRSMGCLGVGLGLALMLAGALLAGVTAYLAWR
ncbi:MAG: DUF3592 domain-containing protein [Nocardioides sp.]